MPSYFLRAVTQNRWYDAYASRPFAISPNFRAPLMADVFNDVRTENNALSVYRIDSEAYIREVVAGLALRRRSLGTLDYLLFDVELVGHVGIASSPTRGITAHLHANELHSDLIDISFYQLTELVLAICRSDFELVRVERPSVAGWIEDAAAANQIDSSLAETRVLNEALELARRLRG